MKEKFDPITNQSSVYPYRLRRIEEAEAELSAFLNNTETVDHEAALKLFNIYSHSSAIRTSENMNRTETVQNILELIFGRHS